MWGFLWFGGIFLKKITKNLEGQKFGRLTVIEKVGHDNGCKTLWKCKCDCGEETVSMAYRLTTGGNKSCGCLRKETAEKNSGFRKTHGETDSRIFRCWSGMKTRCYNKNDKGYKNYGGRGIEICEEWRNDFGAFYKWSMANGYRDDLTIDRIDVNGNYEPSNCRWATIEVQSKNRRDNVYLTYNGETKVESDWAKLYGIKLTTLSYRINNGWNVEAALTTPVRKQAKNKPLDTKPEIC